MRRIILFLATIFLIGCGSSSSSSSNSGNNENGNGSGGGTPRSVDLTQYSKTPLIQEQKYSLAYMWNEEKLAKEIYLELNNIYPTKQLSNIANNSEVKHIEYVQNLVEWYDYNDLDRYIAIAGTNDALVDTTTTGHLIMG